MKVLSDLVSEGHNGDASAFASSGSGGSQIFVQQSRPSASGPWVWYETDSLGNIIDMTINDGN